MTRIEEIPEYARIMEIAKAARIVRQATNISLGDFARKMGWSVTHVSILEHGGGTLYRTKLYLMGVVKMAANSEMWWVE